MFSVRAIEELVGPPPQHISILHLAACRNGTVSLSNITTNPTGQFKAAE
jgi:hypothetical protein